MKSYFAYIRVSTVKQGEKGSSLSEQRTAIEAYARRHGLIIAEWFEELETAAKQGRPVFTRMLKALQAGKARGVVTHKIDRSARNLKDWAALGELIDGGIEMHFAHESIDLTSRGGRLSADIQAVVAADFIRNLREEVRKGFYGRLKQGLYPLQAPIGYLDQGGGRPKTIDPLRGPLVSLAFELYATGRWSLASLRQELFSRGLRRKAGGRISRTGMSTILNNPFYMGLIRIRKTGELFQGVHEPLIDKKLFDGVQAVLRGRVTHRRGHRFKYQRLLRCLSCGYALIAERQKGHVYYRCHTPRCVMTGVREDRIDKALCQAAQAFKVSDADLGEIKIDIEVAIEYLKRDVVAEKQAIALSIAAADARLGRLTDALIDGLLDQSLYLKRKGELLNERAELTTRLSGIDEHGGHWRQRADRILELVKTLGNLPDLDSEDDLRDLLKTTTSNLTATRENLVVAWQNPFQRLMDADAVSSGAPNRTEPRTDRAEISRILLDYIKDDTPPVERPRERADRKWRRIDDEEPPVSLAA